MPTRKTVENYIRKNYSVKTFAQKHHFKEQGIRDFMDGKSISEPAFRLIVGCIEVVDGHLFDPEDASKPFSEALPGVDHTDVRTTPNLGV